MSEGRKCQLLLPDERRIDFLIQVGALTGIFHEKFWHVYVLVLKTETPRWLAVPHVKSLKYI